jgi:hypothetical protein
VLRDGARSDSCAAAGDAVQLARLETAEERLRVCDALRVHLRDERGVAPGRAAQELHRRLLGQLDAVRPSS